MNVVPPAWLVLGGLASAGLALVGGCGSEDPVGTGGGSSSSSPSAGGSDGGSEPTAASTSSAQATIASSSSGEVPCTDASTCDDGDPCTDDACGADARCTSTQIVADDGNHCTIDGCDPLSGPTHEPFVAEDGDPCSLDLCDPDVGTSFVSESVLFGDDFSTDRGGWTFGAPWAIGPATASATNAFGMADPGDDTSPTDDRGIAGVALGGSPSGALEGTFHFESAPFDADGEGFVVLEFQRWLGDFEANLPRVAVWDGEAWVTVWSTPRDVADAPPRGAGWQRIQLDVTEHRNPGMRVRFSLTLGAPPTAPSWNIDDVLVLRRGWGVDENVCTVDSCGGGGPIATDLAIDDGDACTTDTCHFQAGVAHTPIGCEAIGDGCCPDGCKDDPDC